MERFEIGDKVRVKDPSLTFDFDVGIGTVRQIWIDREYVGDGKIWTDEEGYSDDEYEETGTEDMEVYFPKIGTTITAKSTDFELVFSAKNSMAF